MFEVQELTQQNSWQYSRKAHSNRTDSSDEIVNFNFSFLD